MIDGKVSAATPKWAFGLLRILLTGAVSYVAAWPVAGFIYGMTTLIKYGDQAKSVFAVVGGAAALVFDTVAYPWVSGCAVGSYGCHFNYPHVLIATPIIFIVLLACQFRAFRRLYKNEVGSDPPTPWHW